MTTHRLCNLDDDEFKRSIPLAKIKALTKKAQTDNIADIYDFLVHVDGEHDYLFYSKKRDEIFKRLKACYFLATNQNLPIYGVWDKLDHHMNTKQDVKMGRAKSALPADVFRLRDEDTFEPRTDEEQKIER